MLLSSRDVLKNIEANDMFGVAGLPVNAVDAVGDGCGEITVRVEQAEPALIFQNVVLKEGRFAGPGFTDEIGVHIVRSSTPEPCIAPHRDRAVVGGGCRVSNE